MKKKLLIIMILISNICLAQNENENKHLDSQIERIKKAEEFELNNQLGKAYFAYQFALHEDSTSVNGKIALHKSDSLRTILQNKIKSEIQGVWKLKSFSNGTIITEMNEKFESDNILIISNNEIAFYEQNKTSKQNKLIKRENIQFSNIPDLWPSYSELIYSDKQIWSFKVNENSLKILYAGEATDKNSIARMVCGNTELYYEKIR